MRCEVRDSFVCPVRDSFVWPRGVTCVQFVTVAVWFVTVLCGMTYSCFYHNAQYISGDFCCSVVRDSTTSLFILIVDGLDTYTTPTHYTSTYTTPTHYTSSHSKLLTHITATLVNTIHHSNMNELDAYSLHTLITATPYV